MLAFVLSGLVAGLVTWTVTRVWGRDRRIIAYAAGFLAGLAAGVFLGRVLLGVTAIPLICVVGAVAGPIGAMRVTRPYGNTY